MKNILLSVVIPVYNGSLYIEKLICMFRKQQMKEFEVIFVDDGSQDDTLKKCLEYQNTLDWVRVIHTPNKGVSHARNIGVEASAGEWIHFMDADDEIEDHMYHDFYDAVRGKKLEVIVCGCMRKNMDSGGTVYCGPYTDAEMYGEYYKNYFKDMQMEKRYWLLDYVWNKWYKTEILQKYDLHFKENISLGEDFEFNTRYFSKITSLRLLKGTYYHYFLKGSGLSGKFQPEIWKIRDALYDAQVQLYSTLGLKDDCEEAIKRQAGQIAFGDIRTFNSKNCFFSSREKIRFISDILNSRQYSLMLEYLKEKKEIKFRLYYRIFQYRIPYGLYVLITLEKWIKALKKS